MTILPTFCGKDCGGNACPLLAHVQDGRVTRVTNNPAGGEFLKGCPRGFNLPLWQEAPDRLLHPLVRSGPRGSGQFRPASWDEALDITAQALLKTRSLYGPGSILKLTSAGCTGALGGTDGLLARFLHLFGGCTHLTSNYSNGAARFVMPYLYGDAWTSSGFDAATMQYSQMIILWGANILDTRMGAEVPQRLMQARKRGAQIVVIDPRRSTTVRQAATWWIPCRPGTDAALMLAVLYVLFNEGLADRAAIARYSSGFDQLERYVFGLDGGLARTPEWAAGICGVPSAEIIRFARAYAEAQPAMLLPGYSIQRVFAGEDTFRLTAALQLATGNFGRRGGSTGSLNNRLPNPRVGKLPVPVLDDQPEVIVQRWPNAVLEGRSGGYPTDIHLIYNLGTNSINQGSDNTKSRAAFEKVDFAVTHELFMTPTARFCDVIFPAAAPMEKEDIGIPWAGNYLLYKPQVVAPRGEARSDYDILCALAGRLGFEPAFSEGRTASQWIDLFIDQSDIPDPLEFRRTGLYQPAELERVGLDAFAADPIEHPLSTPSGKVEIASPAYAEQTGFPAIPTWQQPPHDPRSPLLLITPKSPLRIHSQGSNIAAIRAKAAHSLGMHPADAAHRGIVDGVLVRVYNQQGSARIPVHFETDLFRGVVSLPEGVWLEVDGEGVDISGSANTFTATLGTAPATACIMHALGVEVEIA